MISHLGINGVRAQLNGQIERKGGERVTYLEGEGELPVIFENEYFIRKDEDNFLGVLLIPPPKNKEVLARNLWLGRYNKNRQDFWGRLTLKTSLL